MLLRTCLRFVHSGRVKPPPLAARRGLSSARIDDATLEKLLRKLRAELGRAQRAESADLERLLGVAEARRELSATLGELQALADEAKRQGSAELLRMAEEERAELLARLQAFDRHLVAGLVPADEADSATSAVLEVTAGVGGQEAMLFAGELLAMYAGLAERKAWTWVEAQRDPSDLGGLRHASVIVGGRGVFASLKHEAGVHRVQRVPATEKGGRVHTSTVAVTVLPEPPDELQVVLRDKDLKIETKRASGAGGQHVNTTDSAVRVLHIPTGIAVECQVDRSQRKNREIALQRLRAKIYDQMASSQAEKLQATKKSQVRSNFRNEKIRTYNFGQDRITDHRLKSNGTFHNLKVFMLGGEELETAISRLHEEQTNALFDSVVKDLD